MGLDIVEYVMALEATFGIEIPDGEAAHLSTVGRVVDHLSQRLPPAVPGEPPSPPLDQVAFYRLRRALEERTRVPKPFLRPGTPAREVLTAEEWRPFWHELAPNAPVPARDRSLGETARSLGIGQAAALRPPGARWTRAEIEEVVWRVTEHEFGIRREDYTLDSRFTDDMHVD